MGRKRPGRKRQLTLEQAAKNKKLSNKKSQEKRRKEEREREDIDSQKLKVEKIRGVELRKKYNHIKKVNLELTSKLVLFRSCIEGLEAYEKEQKEKKRHHCHRQQQRHFIQQSSNFVEQEPPTLGAQVDLQSGVSSLIQMMMMLISVFVFNSTTPHQELIKSPATSTTMNATQSMTSNHPTQEVKEEEEESPFMLAPPTSSVHPHPQIPHPPQQQPQQQPQMDIMATVFRSLMVQMMQQHLQQPQEHPSHSHPSVTLLHQTPPSQRKRTHSSSSRTEINLTASSDQHGSPQPTHPPHPSSSTTNPNINPQSTSQTSSTSKNMDPKLYSQVSGDSTTNLLNNYDNINSGNDDVASVNMIESMIQMLLQQQCSQMFLRQQTVSHAPQQPTIPVF